ADDDFHRLHRVRLGEGGSAPGETRSGDQQTGDGAVGAVHLFSSDLVRAVDVAQTCLGKRLAHAVDIEPELLRREAAASGVLLLLPGSGSFGDLRCRGARYDDHAVVVSGDDVPWMDEGSSAHHGN